mmetsp:Transcript_6035/g.10420  ORF Transcript_6035/g.10420 Transcript_6035/m.10420 type:complete len:298 (-) Transcript_6035:175-1068(-)
MVRALVVGDTHNCHDMLEVPDGDILIHCGDLKKHGTAREMQEVNSWLEKLPHRHKVVIYGNMEQRMQRVPSVQDRARFVSAAVYLEDTPLEIAGLRLYGSPYAPKFHGAFQLEPGSESEAKWASIREGFDILITHGPPQDCLDCTSGGLRVGCASLLQRVKVARPRYHVFGHVHEQGGKQVEEAGIIFVNAAQHVMMFDIEPRLSDDSNVPELPHESTAKAPHVLPSLISETTVPDLPQEQVPEDGLEFVSSAQHELVQAVLHELPKSGTKKPRRWQKSCKKVNTPDETMQTITQAR